MERTLYNKIHYFYISIEINVDTSLVVNVKEGTLNIVFIIIHFEV